ncbi:MAG: class I SAM-dependent methyltransferase [Bacteroidota bacterium]|nr:class I SAM-dependent methyltransferase [Bacteroidota bacterium]MDP4236045.1 class I SAM-dependent methyltransferase [Bacteroidota bacterium]
MEQQSLEAISRQQKQAWDKFSSGWEKWDELTMDFLKPQGDAIITALRLSPTDRVLDIASGTGEPALSIAKVVSAGKVIATDLSDGMLGIAKGHAVSKGIVNFEAIASDATKLPFADNSFDAVSCRLGMMFFPDMKVAAKEMARVVKPGGRVVTTVWGSPSANPWVTAIMGPMNELLNIPAPPPGAPGIFRCATPGIIEDIFREVGLKNIASSEIAGIYDYHSEDNFWTYMNDVVAPVVAAMSKATPEEKQIIRNKMSEAIQRMNPDGGAKIEYSARMITAEK